MWKLPNTCGDRLLWICITGHPKCHLATVECLVVDNCGCWHHCFIHKVFSSRSSVSILIASVQADRTIIIIVFVVVVFAFAPGWLTQWHRSIHDLSLFHVVLFWLMGSADFVIQSRTYVERTCSNGPMCLCAWRYCIWKLQMVFYGSHSYKNRPWSGLHAVQRSGTTFKELAFEKRVLFDRWKKLKWNQGFYCEMLSWFYFVF